MFVTVNFGNMKVGILKVFVERLEFKSSNSKADTRIIRGEEIFENLLGRVQISFERDNSRIFPVSKRWRKIEAQIILPNFPKPAM